MQDIFYGHLNWHFCFVYFKYFELAEIIIGRQICDIMIVLSLDVYDILKLHEEMLVYILECKVMLVQYKYCFI